MLFCASGRVISQRYLKANSYKTEILLEWSSPCRWVKEKKKVEPMSNHLGDKNCMFLEGQIPLFNYHFRKLSMQITNILYLKKKKKKDGEREKKKKKRNRRRKEKDVLLDRIWLKLNVFQWLIFMSWHATFQKNRLYYILGCNSGLSEVEVQVWVGPDLFISKLCNMHT